ncbi:GNAT family N-acetyltransferase [Geoglobus acetivorans]
MMSSEVKRQFLEFKPVTFRDRKGDEVTIRQYHHEEDRERLISMYESFSPDNRCLGLPPSTRIAIENWIDYLAENGFAIVAELGGKLIGHCVIVPTADWKKVDLSIFVHQDYQDRGIGQALLGQIIDYAKRMGFDGIMLVTERDNHRAVHVYKKFGFRIVNPEHEFDMYLQLR